MNTSLPSWLLPVGICVFLFAVIGCLAGPAVFNLTQSAGTGWGALAGLMAGGLFAIIARAGSK